MDKTKLKSFTLSELLVVMIITVIVVGMAFTVLRLVQSQTARIQDNLDKIATLAQLEQVLTQDFSRHPRAILSEEGKTLVFISDIDTVIYKFQHGLVLRQSDSIKADIGLKRAAYEAETVDNGNIDALDLSADKEIPGYCIFVCRYNDSATKMSEHGI